MKQTIVPAEVKGSIDAPPSKSMMQRALAAALLTDGITEIINPSACDDSLYALKVIKNMGARITQTSNKVIVKGGLHPASNILNCGESGLCIRMFSPIAALFDQPMLLTGSGSLSERPMDMIKEPLELLGVEFKSTNGKLPLEIKGPITGQKTMVDGSVSSQLLTGLLLALPLLPHDTNVVVKDLKSKPYIDMTIDLLSVFGIKIHNDNYKSFNIEGGQQYNGGTISVEGDWSGASMLLVAGAIGGEVEVNNLSVSSYQADKAILSVLHKVGAQVSFTAHATKVSKNDLKAFEFDATHCPDLFPPLVALAVNCYGRSIITGINRLKYKESNRKDALIKEFRKLGCIISEKGNSLEIAGGMIGGGTVDSHNDHRIAMSLALASLNATDRVIIEGSECISKSYPSFFNDLRKIMINNREL